MSDAVPPDGEPGHGGQHPATSPDGFDRLRELLLAAERGRLADVERRLSDAGVRAEELSRVLPDALARASRRGTQLGVALSSVLEETIAASLRRNRRSLAETLAPAMGPAIRRAIAETLRTLVDSFNQVLQYSLSPRALRWRFEAWRTGRPFAEVLLSHSLLYRVERVFLVHRATGLLLEQAPSGEAAAHDADLVSGMLTAIQDFVRDSFSVDAAEPVDTMRVGELVVWVEQAQHAYLAAVIRGTPPVGLRAVLRDALEALHLELADAFEGFSGDAAPFAFARQHLDGCLQLQVTGPPARRTRGPMVVAAGLVAVALAVWLGLAIVAARRWHAYVDRLEREPGIVVVQAGGGIWRQSITGLADRFAVDPRSLLPRYGLDPARLSSRWQPFISEEPAIVLARATALLQPPASVTLALSQGVLTAAGSAPHAWLRTAGDRATAVPGITRWDASGVTDEGWSAIEPSVRQVEALAVRFDVGAAQPTPDGRAAAERLASILRELVRTARAHEIPLRAEIVGRTDGTGSEALNVSLSRARAEWVLSMLEARDLRGLAVSIVGAGASRPLHPEDTPTDRALNRSVTVQVSTQQQ